MRRTLVAALACLLVAASLAAAQQKPAVPPEAKQATSAAKTVAGLPDKEMLSRVMEGWASLNPDNVTKYYDQASPFPFYDAAPLKYDDFAAYMAGFKELAATLASLKFTINPDAAVHAAGPGWAVSTATMHMVMTDKAGKAQEMDGRWTAVWQKKGAGWVIVHDHFSVPAQM